jgi:hypothetical protein
MWPLARTVLGHIVVAVEIAVVENLTEDVFDLPLRFSSSGD